jgi:hypothetical protein
MDPKLLGAPGEVSVIFPESVDELEVLKASFETELSLRTRMEEHNRRIESLRIKASIRNMAYEYLIGCETELRLSVTGEKLFGRHRLHVDRMLRESAPAVLDGLSAAIRRAGESDDTEARSQALTSCRRVLMAVADLVFPARESPHTDTQGVEREVGANQYRNRLIAAIETAGTDTHSKALQGAISDFATRLDSLDELTQKGVHAQVTEREMEFGVVQTYLLAGEVLSTIPIHNGGHERGKVSE